MYKGAFGVHEVEFVGEGSPGFGYGCGVGEDAAEGLLAVVCLYIHREILHSAIDLGEITVWNQLWWLIADSDFESGWTPVDEL